MIVRLRHALTAAALLALAWSYVPEAIWLVGIPLRRLFQGATIREGFYGGAVVGLGPAVCMAGMIHAGATLLLALVVSYILVKALMGLLVVALWSWLHGDRAPHDGQDDPSPSSWHTLPLIVALSWTVMDTLHGAIPNTAPDLLGASQWRGPLLWLAPWGGASLMAFFCLYGGLSLAVWLAERQRRYLWAPLGVVLVLAAVGAARFPGWGLAQPRAGHGPPVRVSVVQGGLATPAYAARVRGPSPMAHYIELSERLQRTGRAPHLEIWPETATGLIVGQHPLLEDRLRRWQAQRSTALWLGVLLRDAPGSYRNGALLLRGSGSILETEAEVIPAFPGGRFVGKKRLALLAEAHLAPSVGASLVTVRVDGAASSTTIFGLLFCLETIEPAAALALVRSGAESLVVFAEGGRFEGSLVDDIHFRHSVVRAAEVGRPVLHAGQHGLTALVAPDGSFTAPWPAYTARAGVFAVPAYSGTTFYVRFGAWPQLLSGVVVGLLVLWGFARRR